MPRVTHLKGGNPAAISKYVENERREEKALGYYSEQGGAPCQWIGQGAADQGLDGQVQREDLERALSGVTTTGIDISKRGNREEERRMGTDLTFAAPKSVSMLAVVDVRILEAQDRAVAEAMKYVEQEMAYARIGKGGAQTEYTGNITAAAYRHEDARTVDGRVDPHLHSHVIVSNLTRRKDGVWASLRLDFGAENSKRDAADAIYKNELARELRSMGYEMERTKDGFEVAHVSRAQIEAFSSRSEQIRDDLSAHGIDQNAASKDQKAAARNATRGKKTQISREEQRWEWRERFRQEGFDASQIMAQAKERETTGRATTHEPALAQESIKSAIRDLGERETVFIETDLIRSALDASMGEATYAQIRSAMESRAGGLLDAGKTDRDGTGKIEQQYTTKSHLLREAEILRRARDGKGRAEAVIAMPYHEQDQFAVPLGANKELHHGNQWQGSRQPRTERVESLSQQHLRSLQGRHLDADPERQDTGVLPDYARPDRPGYADVRWAGPGGSGGERIDQIVREREARNGFAFSDGQRAAVELALTSQDRHVGIVGAAGAGKTTSMSLIVAEYQKAGYEVIGVAPSAAAAKELESAGCNETRTLASALSAPLKEGKRLYVLDEAGMVSAKDYDQFLRRADLENARTISVGDPLQLQAVEAGTAFKQLMESGSIEHAKIDEIQRQKDPQLREIAQAFARGDAAQGVNLAKPYMQEIRIGKGENRTEKLSTAAAQAYLGLSPEERSKTLLLAGTNETRQAINEKVRDGLAEEGTLRGPKVNITALDKLDLTREARKRASQFVAKNGAEVIVQFDKDGESAPKGSQWTVTRIQGGKLSLASRSSGETLDIDPAKASISVYTAREMELRTGDRVVFRQNDKEHDIMNGLQGTVQIDPNGDVSVRTDTGQIIRIDEDKAQVMDYSYARTVHSSQGATVERAIVVGEASRVATAESAYVACSREKTGLTIITDNTEKLGKTWEKFSDRKTAMSATKENTPEQIPEIMKARQAAEQELKSPLKSDRENKKKQEQQRRQQQQEHQKKLQAKKQQEMER